MKLLPKLARLCVPATVSLWLAGLQPTLATVSLVRDINAQIDPAASLPADIVNLNGIAFFTADDGVHGRELWKSDGTEQGTVLVTDILPYNASPNPANLVSANGLVFFTAQDGAHGVELWRSDGTEGGTTMVKDIRPGSGGGLATSPFLTEMNGFVFFAANDGTELWKSDGTEAGTVMVKDVVPGDVYPQHLVHVGDTLFFVGFDVTNGYELWKSDGTDAGTMPVKDIYPGSGSSYPGTFTGVNGTLFFTADDGTNGIELWKSDGTQAGTMMVKNIGPDSANGYVDNLMVGNGELFFTSGADLWKTDGTEAGTELLVTLGVVGSRFAHAGGLVYYTYGFGDTLFKTDGTEAGTAAVADDSFCVRYGIHAFLTPFEFSGTAYFVSQGCTWHGLSTTDGTPEGTVHLNSVTIQALPVNVNGTLFFAGNDGVHGFELWRSDGTSDGTYMVKDINAATSGSSPGKLTDVDGALFFSANDGLTGPGLWKSDGTPEGTFLLTNLTVDHNLPGDLINLDGTLFFAASDGSVAPSVGTELWRSDGATNGTHLVSDIYPGYFNFNVPNHGSPANLSVLGNSLVFSAADTNGTELWISDGTSNGTVILKDIWPGPGAGDPRNLTVVDGTVFFTANDGTNGIELWKSDGTEAGTVLLKDIHPGGDGFPYPSGYLTDVNGTVFFSATDGTSGVELWKSDGTEEGTVLVSDIRTGSDSGLGLDPYLTRMGGLLFFRADDGINGTELWRSDGTSSGTLLVRDIVPGINGSGVSELVTLNETLFFSASDAIGGRELWRSDGTSNGTVRVKDINPGNSNSNPGDLTAFNGRIFFRANDGVHGEELWTSDGTEEGTFLLADLVEGPVGSHPQKFRVSDGTLFFTAHRLDTGVELFAVFREDFGDAPASYPTLLADDGGRHLIPTGGATLFLGAVPPDGGLDAHPDATATGDNLHDTADEDGVALPLYLNSGQTQIATVTATGEGGLLSAWIDWNADGDWDNPGEQVFADLPVAEGANELDLAAPVLRVSGPSFARFRLSTAAGLATTGLAPDGEVEDYQVTLNLPPTLESVTASNVGQEGAWQTSYSFTVTFADDHGLVVTSLDADDVTVTGSSGPVAIISAEEPSGADGSPKHVTYTLVPPGGGWNDADNGTYTIALAGDQVADLGGLFIAANPAAASFNVDMDTTPPETFIADQPAHPTNQTSALFALSGDDGAGTGVGSYEYSLDGGAFLPATNPQAFDGLTDGAHTFQVRAIDLVGNVDASPASFTWTVDTIPPETEITGQPTDPTAQTEAAFSFDGSDDGGTGVAGFETSLDGAPFAAATSPQSLDGLGDGMHRFEVRAVDAAGNADPTPAALAWIVDLTPPDTAITGQPRIVTARTTATFDLAGHDALTEVARFEVSLDDEPFVPATSPHTLSGLSDGVHTLRVRAIDTVGNVDPSPASYTWTVNAIPSPAFAISEIRLLESGLLRIRWIPAGPAFVYTVEESDLLHDHWQPLDPAASWPIATTKIELPLRGSRQFFRVRAEPID